MSNKLKRNERGITLVALIITIIVLIILAAVTINAAFKSDFIGTATNGTINYAEAQVDEQKQTEELDIYLKDALLKIAQNNQSGTGDTSSPTEPPTSSPTPDSVPVSTENDIGKYVNYVPKEGTYGKDNMVSYSGSIYNEDLTTDTSLKWRIFKVENDILYLISDKPTTSEAGGYQNRGGLSLTSYDGCNNGVKLLNDICSTCYSNSDYSGLVARSINISDVENVTEYEYKKYTNGYTTYNTDQTYSFISIDFPNIFLSYETSDSNIERRSEQDMWYTGYNYENYNLTVKQTYWKKVYLLENANTDWINPRYYELLISPTNDENYYPKYWIASRYIDTKPPNGLDIGIVGADHGIIGPTNYEQKYIVRKWWDIFVY